jgi:hypothetical protein
METSAWKLRHGNFGMETSAWKLRHGNFGMETSAWKLRHGRLTKKALIPKIFERLSGHYETRREAEDCSVRYRRYG